MNELTPMQKLIEILEKRRNEMKKNDEEGLLLKNEYIHKSNEINSIQLIIAKLLPKEEEIIIDAGNTCAMMQYLHNEKINKMTTEELLEFSEKETLTHGQEYYNQKFSKK